MAGRSAWTPKTAPLQLNSIHQDWQSEQPDGRKNIVWFRHSGSTAARRGVQHLIGMESAVELRQKRRFKDQPNIL